jgi:hypothetical protein
MQGETIKKVLRVENRKIYGKIKLGIKGMIQFYLKILFKMFFLSVA